MPIALLDSRNRHRSEARWRCRPGASVICVLAGILAFGHPDIGSAQARGSVQVGAQVLSAGPVMEGVQALRVVLGPTAGEGVLVQTRLATVMRRRSVSAPHGGGPRSKAVEVHFLRN